MVEPGRRCLGGRYELISLLATGGMGQVWRAHDTRLDRPVAVKVLRSEYTGDPTFVARFRAEARHTAVLAHRNIAALHDYGEAGAGAAGPEPPEHLAYLVMELVEGEALSDLLARERRLGVQRTLDMLEQTAAALAAAHAAGVVHRDVKPGNVLVGADGIVKITDFGVAWSASSVPLTQTGQVVGTAHYLSPERAAGSKAGPAGDVYALGMIGYECLVGRRAFDGDNSVQIALRQIRETPDPLPDDVPENVRRLIGRALLKDPEARFPDGAAFRDAVRDVLAGRMLTPPPDDSGTRQIPVVGAVVPPRGRATRLLTPLVALLAGAGIAVAALQLLGVPSTASSAAATGTPGPASVVLAADDYVGRPVAEVEAELGALGLSVERVPQETATQAAGLVTAMGPTGSVREGARVTVSYAVAPVVAPPLTPASEVPTAPVSPPDDTAWATTVTGPPAGVAGDGDVGSPANGKRHAGDNGNGKDKSDGQGRGTAIGRGRDG